MYWIGVVLATIGASLILGALTFVSTLIGVLVNAMIVLMCGPLIDRLLPGEGPPRPVEPAGQPSFGVGASGVVAERMAAS